MQRVPPLIGWLGFWGQAPKLCHGFEQETLGGGQGAPRAPQGVRPSRSWCGRGAPRAPQGVRPWGLQGAPRAPRGWAVCAPGVGGVRPLHCKAYISLVVLLQKCPIFKHFNVCCC